MDKPVGGERNENGVIRSTKLWRPLVVATYLGGGYSPGVLRIEELPNTDSNKVIQGWRNVNLQEATTGSSCQ